MEMKNEVKNYFEVNAEAWLLDAYERSGFNYPTPQHRLRIVKEIIQQRNEIKNVIDLGCGGGDVTLELAKSGFDVLAVDQSEKMLEHTAKVLNNMPDEVKARVKLEKSSIESFVAKDYDSMLSMGVIGYMPSDDVLFELASKVLRKGGYYIVSFRNRLFNLYSISDRTLRESNEGNLERLVKEAGDLYKSIDVSMVTKVLQELHNITGHLLKEGVLDKVEPTSPSEKMGKTYQVEIEARQTTPNEAAETAKRYGFELQKYYGVHPHFIVPGLNQLLPPQIYNMLSDSLIPLESTPTSLLWSSVFIGVFKKID